MEVQDRQAAPDGLLERELAALDRLTDDTRSRRELPDALAAA